MKKNNRNWFYCIFPLDFDAKATNGISECWKEKQNYFIDDFYDENSLMSTSHSSSLNKDVEKWLISEWDKQIPYFILM